jgi:hypothetical protein
MSIHDREDGSPANPGADARLRGEARKRVEKDATLIATRTREGVVT